METRTITVKGVGKAVSRPDQITIPITLTATDTDYRQTMRMAGEQHEALQASLPTMRQSANRFGNGSTEDMSSRGGTIPAYTQRSARLTEPTLMRNSAGGWKRCFAKGQRKGTTDESVCTMLRLLTESGRRK